MLFGNKDGVEADEFWKEREADLGTPILAKVLGQVLRDETPAPLWGLFYTTEKALYFQTFKSDNWLSAMFSNGKKSKSRTKDETIEIPAESMEYFRVRHTRGGLFKIFHQPSVVELRWKAPITEVVEDIVFEMEGDAAAFISTIPLKL